MAYWHNENPWSDKVVYVPLEELAEACAGGTVRIAREGRPSEVRPKDAPYLLSYWSQYGEKLDGYILPQPSGIHSVGVRYGSGGNHYFSPYPEDREKIEELLRRYSNQYEASPPSP